MEVTTPKCRHRFIRIQGTMGEARVGVLLPVVCTECGEQITRAVVTMVKPENDNVEEA